MRATKPLPYALTLAVLVLLPATTAWASYPVGVWAHPTAVEILHEGTDNPEVRMDGLFATFDAAADDSFYWQYLEPLDGYMYYACGDGEKDACLQQWAEIAAWPVDTECVGWGAQDEAPGTVRALSDALENPDTWALGVGVVGGVTPCNALSTWISDNGWTPASTEPDPEPEPQPEPQPEVDADAGATDDTKDAGVQADVPMPPEDITDEADWHPSDDTKDAGGPTPLEDIKDPDTGGTGGASTPPSQDTSGCLATPSGGLPLSTGLPLLFMVILAVRRRLAA